MAVTGGAVTAGRSDRDPRVCGPQSFTVAVVPDDDDSITRDGAFDPANTQRRRAPGFGGDRFDDGVVTEPVRPDDADPPVSSNMQVAASGDEAVRVSSQAGEEVAVVAVEVSALLDGRLEEVFDTSVGVEDTADSVGAEMFAVEGVVVVAVQFTVHETGEKC